MKISVTEKGEFVLNEVYNPIHLLTISGSHLSICMRDGGFEINFNGAKYSAQGTTIIEMP